MSNYSHAYPCGCVGYAYDNGRIKGYSHELTACALHGAAPELLEACKLTRKVVAVACGVTAPYIKPVIAALDAAIQKAEAPS